MLEAVKEFYDVHEKVQRKKGEKFKASKSRIAALTKSKVCKEVKG